MKNVILLTVIAAAFMGGCKKETKTEVQQEEQNFAVVWRWQTSNVEYVKDHVQDISSEFTELWQNGVVENAYYDTDSQFDKLEELPNITFFMGEQTKKNAEKILNELTLVENNIAAYGLYPVGELRYKRNEAAIEERGLTKSFVSIWNTKNKSISEDIIAAQKQAVDSLFNSGVIENAYIGMDGTQPSSGVQDLVFFVNANTEEEAREICFNMPFYEAGLADFKLHQTGIFWMGIADN